MKCSSNKQTPNVSRFPSQCFNTYFHWDKQQLFMTSSLLLTDVAHMFRSVKYANIFYLKMKDIKQFIAVCFFHICATQTVDHYISASYHSYFSQPALLLSQFSYLTRLSTVLFYKLYVHYIDKLLACYGFCPVHPPPTTTTHHHPH